MPKESTFHCATKLHAYTVILGLRFTVHRKFRTTPYLCFVVHFVDHEHETNDEDSERGDEFLADNVEGESKDVHA